MRTVFRIKTIIYNGSFTKNFYSEEFDNYPTESDIMSFYGEVKNMFEDDYSISDEVQVEKFYIM